MVDLKTAGSNKVAPVLETTDRALGADPLLDGLLLLCEVYGRPATSSQLTAGLPLDDDGHMTLPLIERAAARVDLLTTHSYQPVLGAIPVALFPLLACLKDGSVVLIRSCAGEKASVVFPQFPSKTVSMALSELEAQHTGSVIFCVPAERKQDDAALLGDFKQENWFWSKVAKRKWDFVEVAGAAALTNILALASALFSRQVFDRVIPNESFATLWVLLIGLTLAILFELTVRSVRAYLVDVAGKRIDLELSAEIFAQAMSIQLLHRPKSTGSFVNQVRECDSVRDFFTSTTIAAISDLPFVFLFIFVIWVIGGPMAWVFVAAIPLIVLPGLLAQFPLRKASRRHMRESSVRNGLLIEAMTGAENLKVLGGEGSFQNRWEEYSKLLAGNSTYIRSITNTLTYFAGTVQQLSYAMIMVFGVYLITTGQLTTGGLLACSILSSRAISPLTQLANILGRWQQMQVALSGLNAIMKAPVDRPSDRNFVSRPSLEGGYKLDQLVFRYEQDQEPTLQIDKVDLELGSATAVLGKNGSGKSTLLKVLAGLYHSQSGNVFLDGTDIRQIDPVDIRRQIAYLPQDVTLFSGTLRENLQIGLGRRSDEDLMNALRFVGADNLAHEHPKGLDRAIGEGGIGVSGGQRQSVGLARVWLRDPRVVLLDEPTAAMDYNLEMKIIDRLQHWCSARTVVIATHRQPILKLTNRAMVLGGGSVLTAGNLDEVLRSLAGADAGKSRAQSK